MGLDIDLRRVTNVNLCKLTKLVFVRFIYINARDMPEIRGRLNWANFVCFGNYFCGNVLVEKRGGLKCFNFQTFNIIVQLSLKLYLHLIHRY